MNSLMNIAGFIRTRFAVLLDVFQHQQKKSWNSEFQMLSWSAQVVTSVGGGIDRSVIAFDVLNAALSCREHTVVELKKPRGMQSMLMK